MKPKHFGFPSYSYEGMTHYVGISGKNIQCSCERKLYSMEPCSHLFNVFLGEAKLPEEKPKASVIISVVRDLEVAVLNADGKVTAYTRPHQDIPYSDAIKVSNEPKKNLLEDVKALGLPIIGVSYDPDANKRIAVSAVRSGRVDLLTYLRECALANNKAKASGNYSVAKADHLAEILNYDQRPRTPESVVRQTIEGLLEISDFELAKRHAEIRLAEYTGPKDYFDAKSLPEALADINEHVKRRQTKPFKYVQTQKTREQIFAVRASIVETNIRRGLFLRNFMDFCYRSLGKETPELAYNLPTHILETVYMNLTGEERVLTR